MTGHRINRELYDSIDISEQSARLGPMPPRIRERIRTILRAHEASKRNSAADHAA